MEEREKTMAVASVGKKERAGIFPVICFGDGGVNRYLICKQKLHFISLTAFRIREYCSEFLKVKIHQLYAE